MATVRVPKAPEPVLTVDLATRPRIGMALPAYKPGSFAATQPSLEPGAAKAEASRCFRCDSVYRCEQVHVQSGRGPTDRPVASTVERPPAPMGRPTLAESATTPESITGGRD
jgi:hypothetical protein